jgi:ABC-type glycerol-3-phosphate transport system permease component
VTTVKNVSETYSVWTRFRRWARVEGLGTHILLIVVMLFVFIPLLWMIGTTFKDRLEFSTNSAAIIPRTFSMVNYEYMMTAIENLPIYMRNSFILAIGVVVVQVFVAALAGYAFARMQFRFRDLIFVTILISMFIPRVGGMFAEYELMSFLKLRNSVIGLILLFSAGVPVPIFIMRQTFQAIPKEIEESALIDGANWFQVFWSIALPLAAGGIIIIATLSFIGVWSDYLRTYIMIDQDTAMTISVGVKKVLATSYEAALSPRFRGLFAGEASDLTMLFTAALPVIVFYGALQRWFMKGLMGGAIKF